ncbi:alanine racemase [Malaciobacter halophilus]|uniref:Alanine racemase n=1 Tax=Malaciobacter halophilus TaxID=197482 RepID=A0A2N1J5S7_9BACT|nr:alanine racemase [Malaciobacter halophilus]AXH09284.1 alanine racemase [Malaciobacter halophilus]PKI81918.1 alanine racemase [Malaciobacter halophilus]
MAKILLNKKNLFHNLNLILKQTKSKEKVAIVLKDNAYGHGLLEIAKLAKEFGIKKAVVRTCEEARKINNYFDYILILADTNLSTYSHTFHIAVNSLEQIKQLPKNTQVHLKVDSGMHRNGINKDKLKEAIHGLYKQNLKFTGLFTHYRCADELATDFYWQRSNFRQIKEEVKNICEQLSIPLPKFHSANSSALFRINNFDEDFARVGIASYGYLETDNIFNNPDLKPVMSLWGQKIATREIKKGQRVGYGGGYIAKKDMTISTYDVGYGDGFFRLNEKHKYITPKGYEILGRVSMDNLSVNCNDENICIFNDARQLAKIHDTITYEITTKLNPTIKKEIIQ